MKVVEDQRLVLNQNLPVLRAEDALIDVPRSDAPAAMLEDMDSRKAVRPVVQIHLVAAFASLDVEMTRFNAARSPPVQRTPAPLVIAEAE